MSLLLLTPPAVAADEALLKRHRQEAERRYGAQAELQMLDRLAQDMVRLEAGKYGSIVIAPSSTTDSSATTDIALSPAILAKILAALVAGGEVVGVHRSSKTDAVLSGFLVEGEGPLRLRKPDYEAATTISIKRPWKEKKQSNGTSKLPPPDPVGVNSDDDLIDENTLLGDESLGGTIMQPPECRPKPGKRRKACANCTCGLAEKLASEPYAPPPPVLFDSEDLAEVDFTVAGKASSCGNCALGDAFRCEGCPYIGMPAFKPGEMVQMQIADDI